MALESLFGMKVILSEYACEFDRKQVRFPRSKKKRIRKKWAGQDKNFVRTIKPVVYKTKDAFIMHPQVYATLQRELEERSRYGHHMGSI